jgi:hypothetical protein
MRASNFNGHVQFFGPSARAPFNPEAPPETGCGSHQPEKEDTGIDGRGTELPGVACATSERIQNTHIPILRLADLLHSTDNECTTF